MSMGTPYDCMPVGLLYPDSARFANNWGGMLYRSRRASNVSACSGTLFPFVVTRCRGMGGSSSIGISSSSVSSSSSSSTFRFFPFRLGSLSADEAFRFGAPPSAYLKKFSSGGSSPEALAEVEALGSCTLLPCERLVGRNMHMTKKSHIKQPHITLELGLVEFYSSSRE